MKRSRFLPYGIAILVVFGLVSGCSRGPSEEELAQAAFEEQLATLQQQYDALQQAREDLAASEATLAEIEAIRERDRTEEQKAELEALPAAIVEQGTARDAAYDAVQATLADFLNIALNDFPEHPATLQGLNLYSDEAMLIADETVLKAGDYKKALNQLDAANSYYDSIDLPPYQPLVDKMAELDDMRFITKERFDLVKKNMTMDEVKEVAGVPYYQNIQVDEKRKVESWLYRKREGGAAAIYFKTTNNKVYSKNFEAVKPKVVAEERIAVSFRLSVFRIENRSADWLKSNISVTTSAREGACSFSATLGNSVERTVGQRLITQTARSFIVRVDASNRR